MTQQEVTEYYGKVLTKTADLKTSCCTTAGAPPPYLRTALARIHPEVSNKYYGCGLLCPELMRGLRVLDMGCGSGRDCYVLAQLVGETGQVVGVDMSEEQLASARATVDWHRDRFGYVRPNTVFVQGLLEKLLAHHRNGRPMSTAAATPSRDSTTTDDAGVESNSTSLAVEHHAESDAEEHNPTLAAFTAAAKALVQDVSPDSALTEDSFDVIVSNCVVNLSPDKAAVLSNAYRLLKTGTNDPAVELVD